MSSSARPRLPIRAPAIILRRLTPGLFEIEAASGYRTCAHLDHAARDPTLEFATGDRVEVEFSPYDMSQARILGRAPGVCV